MHKKDFYIWKNKVDDELGSWLSAALDDPKVCEEYKCTIREWFQVQHESKCYDIWRVELKQD